MRWLVLLALTGCASANVGGGNNNGDDEPPIDAAEDPPIDAPDEPPPIDAPIAATLQQTADTTIQNGLFCNSNGTRAQSWYRVFAPSEHGVPGRFFITQVTFAIRLAAGNVPVELRLGVYGGPIGANDLDLSLVRPLNSASVAMPAVQDQLLDVPITATLEEGEQLIVEIFSPDSINTGNGNAIGGTTSADTRPSYYRAPNCFGGDQIPRTNEVRGFANVHTIINVSGTH